MSSANTGQNKQPILGERELIVEYDREMDLLTLWDGTPANIGDHVARGLVVFTDEEDLAHIVTLEGAAKLLRPYLFPEE